MFYAKLFSFRGLRPAKPLTRGVAAGPHWAPPPDPHDYSHYVRYLIYLRQTEVV